MDSSRRFADDRAEAAWQRQLRQWGELSRIHDAAMEEVERRTIDQDAGWDTYFERTRPPWTAATAARWRHETEGASAGSRDFVVPASGGRHPWAAATAARWQHETEWAPAGSYDLPAPASDGWRSWPAAPPFVPDQGWWQRPRWSAATAEHGWWQHISWWKWWTPAQVTAWDDERWHEHWDSYGWPPSPTAVPTVRWNASAVGTQPQGNVSAQLRLEDRAPDLPLIYYAEPFIFYARDSDTDGGSTRLNSLSS
jgi:hypothetical protein